MAIRSRRNQYRGINAHLHSYLQQHRVEGPVFHDGHVIDLARALNRVLPEGYISFPERALQIRQFHPVTGEEIDPRKPMTLKPDVSVFERHTHRPSTHPSSEMTTMPTLTLPAIESIDDDDLYLSAVVIYVADDDGTKGKPVTRLELLSPSNKAGGSGYLQYREKRALTLRSGVVMVELDYLHESRPVIDAVPSYIDGDTGAYPYAIIVTDPRPTLEAGELRVYGFGVDAPLPIIPIPLAGDDTVMFDFGDVYHFTLLNGVWLSTFVDYATEPVNFETYHEADRERIKARMRAVQQAHARGDDLEQMREEL